MKEYLVTCNLGDSKIEAYQVSMSDSYVPSQDNMLALKKAVLKKHAPKSHSGYAAPDNCGGYFSWTDHGIIDDPDKLRVIAVSRLDI